MHFAQLLRALSRPPCATLPLQALAEKRIVQEMAREAAELALCTFHPQVGLDMLSAFALNDRRRNQL